MNSRTGLIGKRYRIIKTLSHGDQSTVYLALDRRQGLEVVVKELKVTEGSNLCRRYYQLNQLRHPNLVKIYDLILNQHQLYLVQSYMAGVNFSSWARQNRMPDRICAGAAAILRALHYLHARGFVHRDIKPDLIHVEEGNIGSLPAVRIIDIESVTADPYASPIGTLGYAAPEVLAGEPVSPAADLYSFGVVLYEALFGQLPNPQLSPTIEGEVISESCKGTVLAELFTDLLDSHPARRPPLPHIFETLSLVAGHPLNLTLEDLKGPYFPSPAIVGREHAIQHVERQCHEVKQGKSMAMQLVGYGKTAMSYEICFLAKLAGLEVVSHDSLTVLAGGTEKKKLDPGRIEQLITQLVDSLLNQALTQPLLLCLDGSSLEDPVTSMLVQQLAHAIFANEAQGILLLWTADLPESVAANWEKLELPRLDENQTAKMVREMLYSGTPPLWINDVFSITGGDPCLVVELVRAQIEAGMPDKLVVPTDRLVLIETRLAALDTQERKLMAVISHTPQPLSHRILRFVASDCLAALPALINKGLLIFDVRGIAPANLYLRRVAQSFITGQEVIQLHQQFCTIFEKEESVDPVILGHHLLWAGKTREGTSMLLHTSSAGREDLERASALLTEDDTLLADVFRYLARLAHAQGELPRALRMADTLARHQAEAGALLRAEIFLDAGDPLQALQVLDRVNTPSMIRHLFAARAYFLRGDYQRASAEAGAGKIIDDDHPGIRIHLENIEGLSLIYSGKIIEGLALLDHAEAAARDLHDLNRLARIHNSRGIALQRLGRYHSAVSAYTAALEISQAIGDINHAANYLFNLGTLAHNQMELGQAQRYYQKAARLAARCNADLTQASAISSEAGILMLFGEWSGARDRLDQAATIAQKAGAMMRLGHIHLYYAKLDLLQNQIEQVKFHLGAAERCLGPNDVLGKNATDLLVGDWLLKKGDVPSSEQLINRLLHQLSWDDPEHWRVHLLGGKLALGSNPPSIDKAIAELELGLVLAQRAKNVERLWELHALLAEQYYQNGQLQKSAYHASLFQQSVEELRQKIPLYYRRTFDQRTDIQQAKQLVQQLGDTPSASVPSITELLQLTAIHQMLNQQIASERPLRYLIEKAVELTNAQRGLVLLKEDQDFKLVDSIRVDVSAVEHGMDSFSAYIAQMAITEERSIMAADALEDLRIKENLSIGGLQLRAVLCVPMRINGRISGVLYLDHRFQPNIFQKKHLTLLEFLATQAAGMIEMTRLFQEEKEQRERLAAAHVQVESLNRELQQKMDQQSRDLEQMSERLRAQEEELVQRYQKHRLVGRSKPMRALYLQLDRMAETDLPILIQGESGVGKELVARAIHYASHRRDEPFIAVNCAALPATLIESELFGHKKGSFTGAIRDRPGCFEVAGRGTIFLDEIGDLPREMQPKLLRVLQEATLRRVGDEREIKAHCRVLSATNKPLEDLLANKEFREDLYYRLNVLKITIPPLRERREDIPLLVRYLLARHEQKVSISKEAMMALMDYEWPGNVRQLENELLRAAVLSGNTIMPQFLTIPLPESVWGQGKKQTLHQALQDFESRFIEQVLAETEYNVSAAAKQLGLHRVALHKKLRSLGIDRKKYQNS